MVNRISQQYIIIADAHLGGSNDSPCTASFFELLETISALPASTGVIFLGDIMELWVAAGHHYESETHRRFVQWCLHEKGRRDIIFFEGNHEFFISKKYRDLFPPGQITSSEIQIGNTLLIHGDLLNRADRAYHLLRILLRNPITYMLGCLTSPLFGPLVAQKILLSLKTKNMHHKKYFPLSDAKRYMSEQKKRGISHIIAGHFHTAKKLEENGCVMDVIPAFFDQYEIGLFQSGENGSVPSIKTGVWKDILPAVF